MANISAWLSSVSNRVPGATKDEIDVEVRSVVRDFCTKTNLYKRQLTAINIVTGVSEYQITPPDLNTSIVDIEHVEVNSQPVAHDSEDINDRSLDNWRAQESNQPTGIMVNVEKILRLKQIPTEDVIGGLVVWVSLKPSPLTDIVPDFIYEDWFECISYGVLANFFKMPKKVWTDINLSTFYSDEYKGFWTRAKGKKLTGLGRMSFRVQGAPFSVT